MTGAVAEGQAPQMNSAQNTSCSIILLSFIWDRQANINTVIYYWQRN